MLPWPGTTPSGPIMAHKVHIASARPRGLAKVLTSDLHTRLLPLNEYKPRHHCSPDVCIYQNFLLHRR
jgi:hypothetical protein